MQKSVKKAGFDSIGATIRTRRESQGLPYAGLSLKEFRILHLRREMISLHCVLQQYPFHYYGRQIFAGAKSTFRSSRLYLELRMTG